MQENESERRALMADIDRAGGIESLRRDERDPAANRFCVNIGPSEIVNSDGVPPL